MSDVSLGAAAALVVALIGLSVPLASIASKGILDGLGAVMPTTTIALVSIHPAIFPLVAIAIAAGLFIKERLMRPRAARALNWTAVVLALLVGCAMLVIITIPVIMAAESLAHS